MSDTEAEMEARFSRDVESNELQESLIIQGDAETVLRKLPQDFFQCCITSPPYWGTRDYGVAGQIGAEQDLGKYIATLTSVFDEVRRVLHPSGTMWLNIGDVYTSGNRGWRAPDKKHPVRAMGYRPPTRSPERKDSCGSCRNQS